MTTDGRMNISSLNENNIDYVANAIIKTVKKINFD